MPVKNVKRKTNDGFEGVITGLNDKEKEIISSSVGIEANPRENATELLSKIKINDKVLASGKTYKYNDIITDNVLKDGIFNEISQLVALGCSNITIVDSDAVCMFAGTSMAVKDNNPTFGLVFHANTTLQPNNTEKYRMCGEMILFQDNSVSTNSGFNLPEIPASSADIRNNIYNLELRYSDVIDKFAPQWTEKKGALSFSALTIPSSELTPSQDDTKKAFFPVSRNAFFDSLFEVKCYQSLHLTYAQNGGFINVPLEVATIAAGNFKALVYAAPSQLLTLKIEKIEEDESYFISTDAEMEEFLSTVESFEFIVLK